MFYIVQSVRYRTPINKLLPLIFNDLIFWHGFCKNNGINVQK